jgi:hypothetical protein
MHDIGLSARAAGASSSSSPSAAGDDDDKSKTRKAHPAFAAAYARLHYSHRAAVALFLLLTVAVAAFLVGRARPSIDCATPRLCARFLALPDAAAAASDFGSLGVPWCKHSRRCSFLSYRNRSVSFLQALWFFVLCPTNRFIWEKNNLHMPI